MRTPCPGAGSEAGCQGCETGRLSLVGEGRAAAPGWGTLRRVRTRSLGARRKDRLPTPGHFLEDFELVKILLSSTNPVTYS